MRMAFIPFFGRVWLSICIFLSPSFASFFPLSRSLFSHPHFACTFSALVTHLSLTLSLSLYRILISVLSFLGLRILTSSSFFLFLLSLCFVLHTSHSTFFIDKNKIPYTLCKV